jgi:hypothetical protein
VNPGKDSAREKPLGMAVYELPPFCSERYKLLSLGTSMGKLELRPCMAYVLYPGHNALLVKVGLPSRRGR